MANDSSTTVDPVRDIWLPDYCPQCNPAGHHADTCVRDATLTEPDATTWYLGSKRVLCEYVCDTCGHTWRRRDLWNAYEAGFEAA